MQFDIHSGMAFLKFTPSVYVLAYSDIWASEPRVVGGAKRLQASAWFHFWSKCEHSAVHSMKADGGTDLQLHSFLISAPDGGVANLCPRHFASGEKSPVPTT